ncbi:MAG: hypothetical protein AAB225_03670 [Acidobacteriota bacterium]
MRRLLFLSVTAGPTYAQLPEDTLRNKSYAPKAVTRKFLEENPGLVEQSRSEDSVHLQKPDGAGRCGSTVVPRGITYDCGRHLLRISTSSGRTIP